MPRLAPATFQNWARKHGVPACGGAIRRCDDGAGGSWRSDPSGRTRSTIIFIRKRAAPRCEVLEHAGFRVSVPQHHLCCGRPLYDFGMLDKAKQYLERIMTVLAHADRRRRSRSSCWSRVALRCFATNCAICFRAMRAPTRLRSQTFLLSEFLERHAPGYSAAAALRKSAAARPLPSQGADEDER